MNARERAEKMNAAAANDNIEGLKEAMALIKTPSDGEKNEALLSAVKHGQLKNVQHLFRYGLNIHYRDDDGNTAIAHAVIAGNRQMYEYLLTKHPELDVLNYQSQSLLMLAALHGHLDFVHLFLNDPGHDVNECDAQGKNAFLHAASGKQGDTTVIMVALLEKNNALIKSVDKQGKTALMCAAENGNVKALEFLLAANVEVDAVDCSGNTALMHAMALPAKNEIIEILIAKGAAINLMNDKGESALSLAARSQSREMIELLIQHKAELNPTHTDKGTALHIAVEQENVAMIELLLNSGADVNALNAAGETPLMCAVSSKTILPFQALLAAKDIDLSVKNKLGHTVLFLATVNKKIDVICALFLHDKKRERKLTPEDIFHSIRWVSTHKQITYPLSQDIIETFYDSLSDKAKCLRDAIENNNLDLVMQMVEKKGAHVNFPSYTDTPLIMAAGVKGASKIIEYLMAKGASTNAVTPERWTPLQVAIQKQCLENVECLVKMGADVNADHGGRSPLRLALEASNPDIVMVLLAKNVSLAFKGNDDKVLSRRLESMLSTYYIQHCIKPLFLVDLNDDAFNQKLDEAKRGLDGGKIHLTSVRIELIRQFDAAVAAFREAASLEDLEKFQRRMSALTAALPSVAPPSPWSFEKRFAQKDDLLAVSKIKKLFPVIFNWLVEEPSYFVIGNVISECLLSPLVDPAKFHLRDRLCELGAKKIKKLKTTLLAGIKNATPEIREEIKAAYTAYCDNPNQMPALFEMLRIHKSGVMNHGSGTWRSFVSDMEGKTSYFSFFSSGQPGGQDSKDTQLQEMKNKK